MQPALAHAVEGRTSATMPARNSYEETQREPDDREAQVSQGPIAVHALENLVLSDRGIVLFRRQLKRALDAMQEGRDPMGIIRNPADRTVAVTASNALVAE